MNGAVARAAIVIMARGAGAEASQPASEPASQAGSERAEGRGPRARDGSHKRTGPRFTSLRGEGRGRGRGRGGGQGARGDAQHNTARTRRHRMLTPRHIRTPACTERDGVEALSVLLLSLRCGELGVEEQLRGGSVPGGGGRGAGAGREANTESLLASAATRGAVTGPGCSGRTRRHSLKTKHKNLLLIKLNSKSKSKSKSEKENWSRSGRFVNATSTSRFAASLHWKTVRVRIATRARDSDAPPSLRLCYIGPFVQRKSETWRCREKAEAEQTD